MNAEDQ
ncbi:Protein of unknown function [Lactobacillus acidophilus DSM 9126]|nr:Protein of unknown function [Lactobacillus acidophilus DSM 20079 = JCM 1132 = NBRC 13951 = CIP 76.13]CDF68932.1 Protein of unknown function [Lactobacillus acidophilus CIRM-BIA 442]CDF70687.1 Protein of unknown function [Lactobacillus acidophilus CIRM-BIA 445]CDF72525.1 Protein of unknown function [Lactobacillus acidophilus DSM 9126]CDF74492.1 Protein of unknown function [Lactobacillus acidophilus DSM 20242]